MKDQTFLEKLAEVDLFPVDWAGRTKEGHLTLTASKFRVVTPVPGLFGYNIAKFGFAAAKAIVELSDEELQYHDFGACTVKRGSLRKLGGEWYMDLRVSKHNRRSCDDFKSEEVLDDDGNVVGEGIVDDAKTTEQWITVKFTEVEPLTDHPLSEPYVETDSETTADLRLNARSAEIAQGRKKAPVTKKARAKSQRVLPPNVAAFLQNRQG